MEAKNDKICCCPICGCEVTHIQSLSSCLDCKGYRETTKQERKENSNRRVMHKYYSQQSKDYYVTISEEKYGTPDKWKEVFVEEELSKNPLFNRAKYEISCQRQKERDERLAYRETHPEEFKPKSYTSSPTPKCPTCGSTSIRKISDLRRGAHAVAWGLLSNTARSQYECLNCSYKW